MRRWSDVLWAWVEKFDKVQGPAPYTFGGPRFPSQVVKWGPDDPLETAPTVQPPGDVLRFVDDEGGGRFWLGNVGLHAGDGIDVLYQLARWDNEKGNETAGLGVWLPCRFEYRLPHPSGYN